MTATTEGFRNHAVPQFKTTEEEFFFRTGLKVQPTKSPSQVAFIWRDTLYLLPLAKSVFQKTIQLLTQTQSDWAVLRSLLEMSTPVSLTARKRCAP